MNNTCRWLSVFSCFVFATMFCVFHGQEALAQNLPVNTFSIRNNANETIDIAVSTYSKQRKGSEVVGWFNIKPGESRSFNKGEGDFLVGICYDGKELPMPGNHSEIYRWLRPGREYSALLKGLGAPATGGDVELEIEITFAGSEPKNPRHDAPCPNQIRWNKKNDGSYEENYNNVSEDILKKTGWRRFRLYEIPKKQSSVNVTQEMFNNARAFQGQ